MRNYLSEYTNEYGEDWIFEYDYVNHRGVVRGSDVEWKNYPVVEGRPIDLILNLEEIEWLKSAWDAATTVLTSSGIYLGLDTEFEQDSRSCGLTNGYCPICLKIKREFECHHCVWSSQGGTNDYFNLLRICNTCHAIITRGSQEDRMPMSLAAFYHQMMYFGMRFIPRASPRTGKHKDRNFLEFFPFWKNMLSCYDRASREQQAVLDETLMEAARVYYQYFRDMSFSKWSWEKFDDEWVEDQQQ
jgi:hypothetical protein